MQDKMINDILGITFALSRSVLFWKLCSQCLFSYCLFHACSYRATGMQPFYKCYNCDLRQYNITHIVLVCIKTIAWLNTSQGATSGTLRYTCVNIINKKQRKEGLFQPKLRNAGLNALRGLKCHFSGKGVVCAKIYSNSSDLNLVRGSNLKQNC